MTRAAREGIGSPFCYSERETTMNAIKITQKSALELLQKLYEANGISKTVAGDYVICHDNGWFPVTPDEAARDLSGNLEDIDLIRSKIYELGETPPVPVIEIYSHTVTFDTETALGEPQAWIYLNDGTSIEITHEEDGLAPEEQYFSLRHHCSENDFESGAFAATMGVIDQCFGGLSDIAPMLERIINESHGISEEFSEDESVNWEEAGQRAVFSLIAALYTKKLAQGKDEATADREADEEACEMTGITLGQLAYLYEQGGFPDKN